MEDCLDMEGAIKSMESANRISFMGVPIDAITMEETVEYILARIEKGLPSQHMAINPGKIIRMMEDPNIRKIVRNCEIISTDGVGVLWFSRLLGCPIPERVTGIELMDHLLAKGAQRGLKPYFLGAKQEVLIQRHIIRNSYPRLSIIVATSWC